MKIVVIGAGLTGLSAASLLNKNAEVIVFEKESSAGGLTRTETAGDFRFDYTGHFLHFNNPTIKEEVQNLFKNGNLLEVNRKSYIYVKDSFVPYPFQSHIQYLPEELKKECLVGFLENIKSGDNIEVNNFYDWMNNQYGAGIVKYFMEPYNRKLWGVHPNEMTLDWMARFVPRPTPEEILLGTIRENEKAEGYNACFYYPKNGIQDLVDKYAGNIGNIKTGKQVTKINWEEKTIVAGDKTYEYDILITTCSLKNLLLEMLEPCNDEALAHAKKLRYTSVLNVNIGWSGPPGDIIPDGAHWLYFPEDDVDFYRVGFPSTVSPGMAPKGDSSCYVELSFVDGQLPPAEKIKKIEEKVIDQLKKVGVIPQEAEIKEILTLPMKTAYVIYDKNWKESRNYLMNYLEDKSIFTGGRYGGWEYSTMEEAIEWGKTLAQKCLSKI
jgi:protoporphyrinogen oxidase